MADFGAEVLLQPEDFDLSQVVLIQATIRGALVRKWIREVKQAYEQVTAEIELNPTQGVHWNSDTLCKPKIVKQVKRKGIDTADSSAKTKLSEKKNVGAKAVLKTSNISEQPWKVTETKPSYSSMSDRVNFQSVEITGKESDLNLSDRITHRASPVGYQDETDILKFNSVETQTSLIEVSPDSKTKISEPEVNILEGLDASWKDRVKPFIDDNYEKFERANINLNKEEDLHLDLDTDRDSVNSQSGRNSDNTKKDDKSDKQCFHNENVSSRSDKSHGKPHDVSHDSLKSCQSVSSRKKGNDTSRSRDSYKSNHSDVHVSDDNRSHRSVRSDHSEGKQSRRSARSDKSDEKRSQRSARSEQSEEGRTQRSARSDQSDGSRRSDPSRGNQSDTGKSQRSNKSVTQTSVTDQPRQSPSSPVEYHISRRLSGDDFARGRQLGPGPNQDSTSLTNVTSVWDSFNSVRESQDMEMPSVLPQEPDKLRELRSNIAMELLWVQQAINSRKNYLRLKGQM